MIQAPEIEPVDALQQPRLRRVMGPGVLLLFIIGDILGTGVYALIGDVAAEVGGADWVPFLLAFSIAAITALSYLELVTKYPQAAGAALYAQKAFDKPFITFLVAFAVMCGHHIGVDRITAFRGQFLHRIRNQLGHSGSCARRGGVYRRCWLRLTCAVSAGASSSTWC